MRIYGFQRCAYCGSKDNLTIDHIIPLSRGGTNREDNLQCLCRDCNNLKGASMPDDLRGNDPSALRVTIGDLVKGRAS